MITLTEFTVLALATLRLSSLIADEDGPFDIFVRLRIKAGLKFDSHSVPYGSTDLSRGMMCQWCNSVWIGLGWAIAFFIGGAWAIWAALPLALSGVVVLISKVDNNG